MSPRSNTGNKPGGQSMVEFGLLLPILMLVLLMIIEGGRLSLAFIGTYTASRDAARYAAAVGDNGLGVQRPLDCAGIRRQATRLGMLTPIQASDVSIRYDRGPGTAVFSATCPPSSAPTFGDRIIVRTISNFKFIVPVFGLTSFPIVSEARRTIISGIAVQ